MDGAEYNKSMELKHLASFVAVAEQLSFIRAARRIHLSQPAWSGQIQIGSLNARDTNFPITCSDIQLL
jgi:Bacterial regulatory helix-turn-helix protein, lysR family